MYWEVLGSSDELSRRLEGAVSWVWGGFFYLIFQDNSEPHLQKQIACGSKIFCLGFLELRFLKHREQVLANCWKSWSAIPEINPPHCARLQTHQSKTPNP